MNTVSLQSWQSYHFCSQIFKRLLTIVVSNKIIKFISSRSPATRRILHQSQWQPQTQPALQSAHCQCYWQKDWVQPISQSTKKAIYKHMYVVCTVCSINTIDSSSAENNVPPTTSLTVLPRSRFLRFHLFLFASWIWTKKSHCVTNFILTL